MNENNAVEDDETEIDLGEVFGALAHWAWLIIVVGLACAVAGYCVSAFLLPEEYESTTQIYVLNKSGGENGTVTTSDLQAGTQLTKDYASIITSRYVLEKVISDLNLNYDYETLSNHVEVTTPTDTRIVSITVTDTDPVMAQKIADEVRKDSSEHIKDVMDIDAVNVVEEANLPTEKSSPNNTRNAAIAGLIGLLVMCVIIVVRYIMDDTIKTQEDIEKYLGLSTLAMIPVDDEIPRNSVEEMAGKKRGRKSTKKGASNTAGSGRSTSAHSTTSRSAGGERRSSGTRAESHARRETGRSQSARRPGAGQETAYRQNSRRGEEAATVRHNASEPVSDGVSDETGMITIDDI